MFIRNYLTIFPNKNDSNNTWFSYTNDFNDFPAEDAKFAQSIIPAYFNDVATFKYDNAHEKLMYIKKYQEVLGAEVIPRQRCLEW